MSWRRVRILDWWSGVSDCQTGFVCGCDGDVDDFNGRDDDDGDDKDLVEKSPSSSSPTINLSKFITAAIWQKNTGSSNSASAFVREEDVNANSDKIDLKTSVADRVTTDGGAGGERDAM